MSNVFSFTGAIGRDAEVRSTPNGQTVLSFTVANNIGFGDRQKTLWVRVTLWGKRAEGSLQNYLKKGQQVFVSGELSQNEYQAQDGTTRTSLELNANIIDLLGKRNDQNAPQQQAYQAPVQQQPAQQQNYAPQQQQQQQQQDDGYDDVPF
ncbi:MAG: single-strand DNA-binding protein [Methyloprofundus sp.]|nr:MAG: single-strand DNA-binding protein [Methyloprofundus sp.]